MELLNLYHQGISSVEVFDKRININWKWEEEKKHWFFSNRKEGFYWLWDDEPTPIENISMDSNLIIDNVVYVKPRVIIEMSNGKKYTKYFDTVEDCNEYISKEGLDKIPHIKFKR